MRSERHVQKSMKSQVIPRLICSIEKDHVRVREPAQGVRVLFLSSRNYHVDLRNDCVDLLGVRGVPWELLLTHRVELWGDGRVRRLGLQPNFLKGVLLLIGLQNIFLLWLQDLPVLKFFCEDFNLNLLSHGCSVHRKHSCLLQSMCICPCLEEGVSHWELFLA